MLIESRVRLIKDIRLTPDYTDTMAFNSLEEQVNFFIGKSDLVFNDITYVRDGVVYLPNYADRYKEYNYLMYRNLSYSDKWYFAFITNVEYVADGTTKITFQQDLIQTWYFEMNVGQCFVEREHVNDDTFGSNTMEEGLSTGDYVVNATEKVDLSNSWIVVASSVSMVDGSDVIGTTHANAYSGLEFRCYDLADVSTLTSQLANLATQGKSDGVIAMYMLPKKAISDQSSGGLMTESISPLNTVAIPLTGTLNGYTPKNNKVLCYPYRAIYVTANNGASLTLKPELIIGNTIAYQGSPYPNGRFLIRPAGYDGTAETYDISLTLGDYPQCSWIKDIYTNWLATQNIRYGYQEERFGRTQYLESASTAINQAYSGVMSALSGNLESAGSSAIGMIQTLQRAENSQKNFQSSMAEEKEVHSIIPPSSNGAIGNESLLHAIGQYGFTIMYKSVKKEFAVAIDNYFSLFGYKVNSVKKPNIMGRRSWNYVKTIGAIVYGNAPQYAIDTLKSCLNNGIRFWHTEDIGNFSLDNSITN